MWTPRAAVYLCLLHVFSAGLLHLPRSAAADVSRSDFPPQFVFGAGSSAYQVEGAAFEDGRTATIADALAHSGRYDGNGDVTCDQYHKYKDDVKLMVETGLEAYRFSISWSRLIPNGRGPPNPKGLEYYNNLINELIQNGIQPHVTLLHQDFPMVLENEYGGFLNPRVVDDFTAYVDVCFREFGDRVLHWSSINEANLFAITTYCDWRSDRVSRRTSSSKHSYTTENSMTKECDPYIIAHYSLLAHASAAKLYKEKYQEKQGGFLGFSLYAFDFIPFRNITEDIIATNRSYIFFTGWFMHPLVYGDYPEEMKTKAGARIPAFTKNESEMLKGSSDFFALNFYSAMIAKHTSSNPHATLGDYLTDMDAEWSYFDGYDPLGGSPFPNTPWGLQGALEYFKHTYDNPPIYIYENGQSTNYSSSSSSIDDPSRVEYMHDHIVSLLEAVRNGSNVQGYFVWSFLDMFEYLYGYKHTFGIYYVDFNDSNLARYPKLSQKWYSSFLNDKIMAVEEENEDNVPQIL